VSKGLGVGRESVVFEIRTASRLAQGWFKGASAALWDTQDAFETSLKVVGFALPPLRMVQKHPEPPGTRKRQNLITQLHTLPQLTK